MDKLLSSPDSCASTFGLPLRTVDAPPRPSRNTAPPPTLVDPSHGSSPNHNSATPAPPTVNPNDRNPNSPNPNPSPHPYPTPTPTPPL